MPPETPRSTTSTQGGIPEARKKDIRLRERFQLPESESCIGVLCAAWLAFVLRLCIAMLGMRVIAHQPCPHSVSNHSKKACGGCVGDTSLYTRHCSWYRECQRRAVKHLQVSQYSLYFRVQALHEAALPLHHTIRTCVAVQTVMAENR